MSHRRRSIKMRTMTRNRLNSVIHRYNLTPPRGELFLLKYRVWVATIRELFADRKITASAKIWRRSIILNPQLPRWAKHCIA